MPEWLDGIHKNQPGEQTADWMIQLWMSSTLVDVHSFTNSVKTCSRLNFIVLVFFFNLYFWIISHISSSTFAEPAFSRTHWISASDKSQLYQGWMIAPLLLNLLSAVSIWISNSSMCTLYRARRKRNAKKRFTVDKGIPASMVKVAARLHLGLETGTAVNVAIVQLFQYLFWKGFLYRNNGNLCHNWTII